MKKFFGKKRAIALAAVAVLAITAAAVAYFTSTGSGTGNGSVGNAGAWTVSPDAAGGGPLYPGSGAETFTGTVTNAGVGQQSLAQVKATIVAPTGMTVAGDASHPCSAADFNLETSTGWVVAADGQSATYAIGQDLAGTGAAGGAGSASWTALTLSMKDANYNQDNCQGATPHIKFDAS